MSETIKLGGVDYEIHPMPLGRLKTALPALNRLAITFSRGELTEAAMDDVVIVLANATGKPQAEVEAIIPLTLEELFAAVPRIAAQSGLNMDGETKGKPAPAAGSTGTDSTAG